MSVRLLQTLRALLMRPSYTSLIVSIMALGIGVNTAVFSLIYAILLRPFPYQDPDTLVRIESVQEGTGIATGASLLDVEDFRGRSRALAEIGAHTGAFDADVREDGPGQAISLVQLHPQALSLLGVQPSLGRLLLPEEDRPGGDVHKALISHRLWRSRYSADPAILGRPLRTNRGTYTIVGIMPPDFGFPDHADVWTPMESYFALSVGEARIKKREARYYRTLARLRPGVTLAQAQADLNTIAAALEREFPKENKGIRVRLKPLREAETGPLRPYLLLLLGAAGFVLLICCANVANLQLVRAAERQRELLMRMALGASRRALLLDLLLESLLLGLAGGGIGAGLAFAATRMLMRLIPVPLPTWMRIEVDLPALLCCLALSLLTGLLFGLLPALSASGAELSGALKEGARTTTTGGARLRSGLVVAEVALSLLLLCGASVMMQSFLRLSQRDVGFSPEGLLVVRVTNFQTGTRADQAAALSALHERVLSRLRGLPGVISAGGTNGLPYTDTKEERRKVELRIRGREGEDLYRRVPLAGADISSDYLQTMRVPLRQGRLFNASDTPRSQMVLIVNQRAADLLWPGRDPIGQQIYWGTGPASPENPYCTVVGVVGDVRFGAAETGASVEVYYPYTQYPVTNIYYVLRTGVAPLALGPAVQRAIRAENPGAAIVFMKTMEQVMRDSLWQRRLWAVLLTVFAAAALVLAGVGLYGVLSYSVGQRRREIGIRVALGARTASIMRLVVSHGLRLALLGTACGLLGAWSLRQVLASLVAGLDSPPGLLFVGMAILLLLIALLACLVPAYRAARVSPLTALRAE